MVSWKFLCLWGQMLVVSVGFGDCRRTYTSQEGTNYSKPGDSKSVISTDPQDIHFYVYHRAENPEVRKELLVDDEKTFSEGYYFSNKSLVILIHGIGSSIDNGNIVDLKNALVTTKEVFVDCNIVVVNWDKLSNVARPELKFFYYPVALNNGELVALKIIRLLKSALAAKALVNLEDVHLIGVGVGVGIANYVAKNIAHSHRGRSADVEIQGKIGRITGLDPVGHFFTLTAHPDLTLSPTSKKLVNFMDIYHTDQGRIGIVGSYGHVDFFPNGGGPIQPDCFKRNENPTTQRTKSKDNKEDKDKNMEEFTNLISGVCSHLKSVEYFKISVMDKTYLGCKCSSIIDSHCMKKCEDTAVFGFFCSPKSRGDYQLVIPRTTQDELRSGYKKKSSEEV